jgi:hypothetical protein
MVDSRGKIGKKVKPIMINHCPNDPDIMDTVELINDATISLRIKDC